MKTNQMLTAIRLMVLGVMVAGISSKAADVPALQGKFTLSSETRWAQATLPAGDYAFSLDHEYAGGVVTVFRGTQTVARIMTVGMNSIPSGRSEILAENGAVRVMNLPTIGVSLHFGTSHAGRRAAPQQPQVAQIIPIAAVSAGR